MFLDVLRFTEIAKTIFAEQMRIGGDVPSGKRVLRMAEWTKIDTQTQKTEPLPEDSLSGSTAEIPSERERPMAVTAVAAYQWLKAALFAQLFWNL